MGSMLSELTVHGYRSPPNRRRRDAALDHVMALPTCFISPRAFPPMPVHFSVTFPLEGRFTQERRSEFAGVCIALPGARVFLGARGINTVKSSFPFLPMPGSQPAANLQLASGRAICYTRLAAMIGSKDRYLPPTTGGLRLIVTLHPPPEIAAHVHADPSPEIPAQGVLLCSHVCATLPSPPPFILCTGPAARRCGTFAWLFCLAACCSHWRSKHATQRSPFPPVGSHHSNAPDSCKLLSSIPSDCTPDSPPPPLHCDLASPGRPAPHQGTPEGDALRKAAEHDRRKPCGLAHPLFYW
jgi:hypothetical protein